MTTQPEISIPSTSTSTTSKPYTIYNITLRLPLRTFTLQKRYSDFITLHNALTSQVGAPPPASLPPKSYFSSTTSSPTLAESRRIGLQTYLQTLNTDPDDRWRNTSAWRSFLNLPSNSNSTHPNRHAPLSRTQQQQQPITDPIVWLDYHRDLKSQLHSARLQLTKRDQATSGQAQHECSAEAKKHLIKASSMITALDSGLKALANDTWGREKLGDGEMRRRRDLISAAQKEREGLENLGNAMVAKNALDGAIAHATKGDKDKLLNGDDNHDGGSRKPATTKGRVLGKESDRTRALDNQGVLQLQQQLMREQDEDVDVLAAAVARQKKIGIEIQEELGWQKDLLELLDEDVDRVQGKMDVARKRIGKIS
ncbi:MAG: hypothetical protein L6R42_009654 [Xanthoria sp. 1 TBL-2021]|nr:MAG: hypothetical protein L6R42_009654 [Xanthoria sp. 1 TBL-2021]